MEASGAKHLRELEAENSKLKRLFADTMLVKTALEDVLGKNGETGAALRVCCLSAVGLFNEAMSSLSAGETELQSGLLSASGARRQFCERSTESARRAIPTLRLFDAACVDEGRKSGDQP